MKIVELHRNPFAKHEHYVLKSEGQTAGAAYEDLIKNPPFHTLENLDVSVHRASTMAALIVLHIDGEPLIGGLPPDISRLYVDRITGTKDEDDSGVHYHVMIYV